MLLRWSSKRLRPRTRPATRSLGARVDIYMAAKKWDMAAAVASQLVKVEPENEAWWITLAYSVRRIEGVEKAEAILLRGQSIHPKTHPQNVRTSVDSPRGTAIVHCQLLMAESALGCSMGDKTQKVGK
jgi:hypothetical protein